MPKTKVRKAPKIDRKVLKSLLLEYIRPQLRTFAKNNSAFYDPDANDGFGGWSYLDLNDETEFEIVNLRVCTITPTNSDRYKVEARVSSNPYMSTVKYTINKKGAVYRAHRWR